KPAPGSDSPTIDRRELRRQLKEIRRTGVASNSSEMLVGSAAVAAPVYGMDGKVIAAIAIGSPTDRFTGEQHRLQEMILDVAQRASGLTGMARRYPPASAAISSS